MNLAAKQISELEERAERDRERMERARGPHSKLATVLASGLPAGWKLQSIDDLLALPLPTEWLVHGELSMGALCCTFGRSGTGKSFVEVDRAASIVTGTLYHGREVKQGPVLYLAGEGHHGIAKRFRAWEINRGVSLKGAALYVSSAAIDLAATQDEVIAAIRAACGDVKPVYIVIDTLHRHLRSGANENSGEDVGPLIAAADAIKNAFGCTVTIVHHVGHAADDRERGWSGLRGALDWSYRVRRGEGDQVVMTCEKSKDHDEPEPITFAFQSVELPMILDAYGELETSAVLRAAETTASARLGANQMIAMNWLKKLAYARIHGGDERPITVEEWREATGLPRNRWGEVRAGLVKLEAVRITGDYVDFIEAGS